MIYNFPERQSTFPKRIIHLFVSATYCQIGKLASKVQYVFEFHKLKSTDTHYLQKNNNVLSLLERLSISP